MKRIKITNEDRTREIYGVLMGYHNWRDGSESVFVILDEQKQGEPPICLSLEPTLKKWFTDGVLYVEAIEARP